MKLKELKRMLDKMSKEQLNKDLIVVADDKHLSGFGEAHKAKCAYIYDGSDDPAQLRTMSELKDECYDKEEIEGMDRILERGDFYIELP